MLYSTLALLLAGFIYLGWRQMTDDVTQLTDSSVGESIYLSLSSWVAFAEWTVAVGSIAAVLIWAWMAWAVFVAISVAVEIVFMKLVPDEAEFSRQGKRYFSVVERSVGCRLRLYVLTLYGTAAMVFIAIDIAGRSVEEIIEIFVYTVIATVVLVYGATWFHFWRIRKTRRPQSLPTWDHYFISKQALFRQVREVVRFIVMLAALGLYLLPGLFGSIYLVEKAGAELVRRQSDYESQWPRLLADGYRAGQVVVSEDLDLPAPDDLELRLTALPQFRENIDKDDLVMQLQKGMFLVVAILGAIAIGLPAVFSSVLSNTRREIIKSAFIAVVSSTALALGLGLFFEKAFFQDPGESFGLGIVIVIVLGFAQAVRKAPNG